MPARWPRSRARHAVWLRSARQAAEKSLPRHPHHHGAAQRHDLVQPPQQLEVVLARLAEADAGIGPDAPCGDTLAPCKLQSLLEKAITSDDAVLVARVTCIVRGSPRMCIALTSAPNSHRRRHAGVPHQRGHVVDHRRPGGDGGAATSAFEESIETGDRAAAAAPPSPASPAATPPRAHRGEPGRVDSPPTSIGLPPRRPSVRMRDPRRRGP